MPTINERRKDARNRAENDAYEAFLCCMETAGTRAAFDELMEWVESAVSGCIMEALYDRAAEAAAAAAEAAEYAARRGGENATTRSAQR